MISVEIEKEINQENKVILGFNMRQVICISTVLISAIFMTAVLKLPFETGMYPTFGIAVLAFLFGWYKPDGIPFEKRIAIELQKLVYGNGTRVYRTKNQYVVMMNREYQKEQNRDLADKKTANEIKQEQKRKEKELKKAAKKAKIKPI